MVGALKNKGTISSCNEVPKIVHTQALNFLKLQHK